MTAIQLYKFIKAHNTEFHWEDNNGDRDVMAFISFWNIRQFNEMLSVNHLTDHNIKCTMKHEYFAFWMGDICEYYGIELEEIFGQDPKNTTP